MKINGNEIKPGNVLQHQETLWAVVKVEHVKPGKGGAFAQVEMKNLIDGRKLNERFRSADKVERVRLEQKDFQYLYPQEDMLVFMNTETYEQIELQADFVGFECPDHFVVGYGMDVGHAFRELPYVGIVTGDA